MSGPQNIWLSTNAAAEQLGITPRTLYRMINSGQLPAYKFGRVIRLKQDELAAFIEASRIEPGDLRHLYPETADPENDSGVAGAA